MNFKKLLAMLLVVSMLAMVFASCETTTPDGDTSKPETSKGAVSGDVSGETSGDSGNKELTDQEIYDMVLGEFYTTYQAASEAKTVSEKFALQAIAEAKLLQSGVMLPTTSNGGNYAIGRVVPNMVSSVLWGNDSYRLHGIMVTTDILKSEDRKAIKELYAKAESAEAYRTDAKKYLADKGYTLKDTYSAGYSSDPEQWDVFATYQQIDSEPIVNTVDGLVEYDVKNNLQPALAESWESKMNDDGTQTYTFKIRKGVKWVDQQGRELGEVKADDWVAAMQHVLDSMGGLEYLVDGLIVNATEYMAKEVTDFTQVGVKAVDDYTLEYTLTGETTYFLTMLGYSIFLPMNRDFYTSQGGVFGVDEYAEAAKSETYKYGTGASTIAYNGPYVITNATAENSITFTKNEKYWNAANVEIKQINWLYNDGKDATKAYNDMVAGTIDGAGLNSAALEAAKADGNFDKYHYVSSTDATAFNAFFNVNRKAYANATDAHLGVSLMTEDQKPRTYAAMQNVHFRRALCHSVDRAAVNAARVGDELKLNNLINSYTPGTFVKLEEDVTVKINGTDTTFKAGTNYGAIVQAQLEADGSKIKAYDAAADGGIGSSAGFDGWYNKEAATAEIQKAVEELKAAGVEVTKENPIHLDYACRTDNVVWKNQGEAYKQSIEGATGGLVVVDLVPFETSKSYNAATYTFKTGAEANYHINTNTGWGPDYGDPKTYLDTMIPGTGGMAKSLGLF